MSAMATLLVRVRPTTVGSVREPAARAVGAGAGTKTGSYRLLAKPPKSEKA